MEIPKLTDERLAELQAIIKPVVPDGTDLWYIQDVDPRTIAFTWDPKPTVRATGLKPLRTVRTLHTYGYHGFFKPSIAEVLAQVPMDLLDKASLSRSTGLQRLTISTGRRRRSTRGST